MRVLMLMVVLTGCGSEGGGGDTAANPCDLPVECPDESGVRRHVNPNTGDVRCQRYDEARDLWLASHPSVTYGNPEDASEATGWDDNATLVLSCSKGRVLWRAVGTGTPESLCLETCDTELSSERVCESVAEAYPPCPE